MSDHCNLRALFFHTSRLLALHHLKHKRSRNVSRIKMLGRGLYKPYTGPGTLVELRGPDGVRTRTSVSSNFL